MNDEPDKEVEKQETQSAEDRTRTRRFGIQVPLYKGNLGKPSTQLTPEEYRHAVERHRIHQESLKRKWMTPKNLVLGAVIFILDLTVLQLLPYIVGLIGIHDQVLLGKWLIGLVGVVTVATLVYIFTSED